MMRKLLDRIADKLGYERKFTSVPIQWPPIPQELIDDGAAMGFCFPESINGILSSNDWPLPYLNISPSDPEIVKDDGSPGNEMADDLFIVKD